MDGIKINNLYDNLVLKYAVLNLKLPHFYLFHFYYLSFLKLPVAGFGGAVVSIVGSIVKKTYVFESIISILSVIAIFHFAAYEIYLLVQ